MRSNFYVLPFLFFSLLLNAQSKKWVNYVNDFIINDIAIEDNCLWVGTQGSLVRIDRKTEERKMYLPSNSGLQGYGIQSVYVAPNGVKWLGGEVGGLMSFNGETWENYYYIGTGDTLFKVSEIKAEPNGNIWIKGDIKGNVGCLNCRRLYKFDGTEFIYMDTLFGLANNNITNVSYYDIAPNGDVWVYADEKVQKYDGNNVVASFTLNDIGIGQNEYIRGIWASHNNEVVCLLSRSAQGGSQGLLKRYDGNQWKDLDFNGSPYQDNGWYPVIKDETGNLWLTYGKDESDRVYAKYNGTDWESWKYSDFPSLPQGWNPPILKHVDQEGHMWVSHYQLDDVHFPKTYEFNGTAWKGYNTEFFPLLKNYIEDVAFDCDGKAWFGSTGFNILNGIEWIEIDEEIGFSVSTRSLTLDTTTCKLWIASYSINNGIASYDGNKFTQYTTGSDAHEILIDKQGTVWAATSNKGIGKFDGVNWEWYNEDNSPVTDFVSDIDMDDLGGIWGATFGGGIVHFDGTNWRVFNETNSIVDNYNSRIFVDRQGFIWSHKDGIPVRFNGIEWNFVSIPSISSSIYVFSQDAFGNYWLGSDDGVIFWDGGTNVTEYNVANSPIGNNFAYKIRIDPFGNKWFVHNVGVSVFNENGISNRIINPPNKVRGQVFFDTDQNGTKAPTGEPDLPGEKIKLEPSELTTYSTIGGQYAFYPPLGNYEINFQPDAPYVPTSPTQLNLLMGNSDQSGFDFGTWSNDPSGSISVDLTSSIARCNETTTLWITVTNHGLFPANGTVELTMYPTLDFLSANQTPLSIQGNTITWEYQDLKPFDYDPIKVELQSPGVDAVGDLIEFNVTATRTENGQTSQTATDYTNTEVRCSFDPNDKKSEATGDYLGHLSLLTDPLDFTIRFQNKGNDTAFVVVIRDTLDADLDPTSFELISFSHPVRPTLSADGVLTFVFENINLLWEAFDEPASHGYVKFRIAPRQNLPDPTNIENTAHIYFDFNPAIVTNTTENTLVETLPITHTGDVETLTSEIIIYPNPTSNGFWAEWESPLSGQWNASVFDATGRLYFSKTFTEKKAWIGDLKAGFYVIVFENNGKRVSKKLVVLENR